MASETQRAIEAILMVADTPVEPSLLAQLLEIAPTRVEEHCAELVAQYEAEDRGFVLVRVAGGYRFQSHPDMAPYLERFVLEGQSAKLSAAALETLAIVAYKQPVSRAQVASIRGVNVDAVVRTLSQRGYITEVGRDPGPGQAVLYGTTPALLEHLGLDSVAELPPLAGFVPGPEIMEALEQGLRAAPAGAGEDEPAADSDSEEGLAEDGPAEDSPAEDGPVEDGPVEDGPVEDGPAGEEAADGPGGEPPGPSPWR